MKSRDLYIVLGVQPNATADDIRRAYLERARILHPDSGEPGASHERFVELQAAYETLSDRLERRRYDAERKAPQPSGLERAWRAEAMTRSDSFVDDLLHDEPWVTLGRIFTGLGFERFSKSAAQSRARLSLEVSVTALEAHEGAAVTVRVPQVEPCPSCAGWSAFSPTRCAACHGRGRAKVMQPIVVQVPPFSSPELTVERSTPDVEP